MLAGCVAHPELVQALAEISPSISPRSCTASCRRTSCTRTARSPSSVSLQAELDALAAAEDIDERAGREHLLRLRERYLRKQLAAAELEGTRELQTALERVQAALAELG